MVVTEVKGVNIFTEKPTMCHFCENIFESKIVDMLKPTSKNFETEEMA